jgi:hypothetical protein
LKEIAELLTNSEIFKDPASILSFCRDRFNQIKDLVDDTDSFRINIDFPRYIHRLRHLATRLRHLFQFAKIGAEMQSSVLMLREELQRFVEEVAGELRTAGRIQPAPTHAVGMAPPSMVEGRPEPTLDISAQDVADNFTHPIIITGALSHQDAQSLSKNQVRSTSYNDSLSGFRAPITFAKFPQPYLENVRESFRHGRTIHGQVHEIFACFSTPSAYGLHFRSFRCSCITGCLYTKGALA